MKPREFYVLGNTCIPVGDVEKPSGIRVIEYSAYEEVLSRGLLSVKCFNAMKEEVDKLTEQNKIMREALSEGVQLIRSEYCSHRGPCSSSLESCYCSNLLAALEKCSPEPTTKEIK